MTNIFVCSAIVAASCALTSTTALAASSGVCSDTYSMTDVDGNGYVSKIEMNAYAEKQSAEMDADKSGAVSRDEYVNCSKAMMDQPMQPMDRTEDDMAKIDVDGDGNITQEEFRKAGEGTYEAAQTGDETAVDRAERMILMINGAPHVQVPALGLEEFAARSGMLFIRLDTNRDNSLTRQEFMEKVPEPVDISEVLNREFDEMDTDKSGDLTTTELIQANVNKADYAMQAYEADTGEKADPEMGAPVVYYTYPKPM